MNTTQTTQELDIFNPSRWGLPSSPVEKLGEGLRKIWERFQSCFKTQTRDGSEYAWFYLRGLLTMDTDRNYANIARRVIDPSDDGQNLQQFISDSPWNGEKVFEQIQTEIQLRPELQGGMLTLDESGDERAGAQSAGAARQYHRAWMHHTALDALALWFVAQTKLDWRAAYPRDPALIEQLELFVLPALSMANVRELLKAVLPLKQLSAQEATRLVVQHLVNRSRSTSSRLKQSAGDHAP